MVEIPVTDFDRSIPVGARGLFLCMKYEIPAMLDSGGGAIVNMASTGGLEAVGGLAPHIAAKFAVVGLTRTAASTTPTRVSG
jgi:NAD(P)-dependent dehydrogenase (short-subunit alcohol dehydrogenase family)